MGNSVQLATLAGFAYVVAGWNILQMFRRGHDRARWAWSACLVCGATAFLVRIPHLYTAIDRAAGTVNLSTLVIDLLFLATALNMHLWTVFWPGQAQRAARGAEGRQRAPRALPPTALRPAVAVAATALVMVVLVVLFALAPHGTEHPTDFEVAYSHRALVSAYNTVYLTAFAAEWPLAALACRRARADARRIGHRPLAMGLVFLEAGMWLAFLYALAQSAWVVGAWTDASALSRWAIPAGNLLASLSALNSVIGSACRTWGPGVERWMQRTGADAFLAFRRLGPLHRLVAGHDPHAPAPARIISSEGETWRTATAQRTVQILDGISALEAYRDADMAQRAAAAAGRVRAPAWPDDAFVEAAVLLAAVRGKLEGNAPASHPVPPHETIAESTAWLLKVSAALPAAGRSRGLGRGGASRRALAAA
jgi:hypothetical protein